MSWWNRNGLSQILVVPSLQCPSSPALCASPICDVLQLRPTHLTQFCFPLFMCLVSKPTKNPLKHNEASIETKSKHLNHPKSINILLTFQSHHFPPGTNDLTDRSLLRSWDERHNAISSALNCSSLLWDLRPLSSGCELCWGVGRFNMFQRWKALENG